MNNDVKEQVIKLYKKMSDMTAPECANTCAIPYHCCERTYCEFTIIHAKKNWKIELKRTDHPKLPLMGPNGCTAAPHLRPICTMHTCEIVSLGFKLTDQKWTKRYFNLRDKLNDLDSTIFE